MPRALAGADVRVTLLDRHNYHLFQPLLYQVATASLSPADIASPIRWILRRQPNVQVLLAEVRPVSSSPAPSRKLPDSPWLRTSAQFAPSRLELFSLKAARTFSRPFPR